MDQFETKLVAEMDKLRKFAWKLTRHQQNTDDLLQSTLCRALEKRHLFDMNTNMFSWTSRIMFNIFVSAYRRSTKFETQYDPELYIAKVKYNGRIDDAILFEEFNRHMEKMTPEHRALAMCLVLEYSYQEIAVKFNIPVGTVKSRISRMRSAANANR